MHNNLADFSKVIANNAQIYQGGAQVLHNIRGVLGTDTFWAGIRLYYSRFQNGNANSDDLRLAMEDACKNAGGRCPTEGRDLTWLFRELLNRGGVLQVHGSWQYDKTGKQVQVTLDQSQASGLYRMPIEWRFRRWRSRNRTRCPQVAAGAAARAAGAAGATHPCDATQPAAPGIHVLARQRATKCHARSDGVGHDAGNVRKEVVNQNWALRGV